MVDDGSIEKLAHHKKSFDKDLKNENSFRRCAN